ncbi:PRC-barrel domain-containing protein [Plantactinospora siamensis]|uniref:PRC-barrel domain-containing protein n=1 Tax=Plantactinospora siamensis TaxID=555372 RepID=A0ABV6NQ09_9ACTN
MQLDPWTWRDPTLLAAGLGPEEADRDAGARGRAGTPGGAGDEGGPGTDINLVGYRVAAVDGGIGTVDEASTETGAGWLVVDTGPWIFGRKVLLPAATVDRIDHLDRTLYVDRDREQIKNSPEYDPETFGRPDYHQQVGDYYRQVPPPRAPRSE